jgi:hypothetical protein
MLTLSQDQIDFLKQHNFYYVNSYNDNKYAYVSGNIGPNTPEFYNIESVEQLIKEIKTFGKPLEDKNAIQFKSLDGEFYEISLDKLRFIDMRINRKTGELEVEFPIHKSFNPRIRKIIEETDDFCKVISRYTGDFGDGSQYVTKVYKSIKSAQTACIPLLITQKNKFQTQIGYIDECLYRINNT